MKNNFKKDVDTKKGIITPRSVDYSQWYLDVIAVAELADNSPVRGCMVIKPNGYAIWENIQKVLDGMFKVKGVKNAYFPLFIPTSFLERESEHVEGFAKECAVVTHHRLRQNNGGKLIPAAQMKEPLVVRPTSETIIYEMFSRWIHSYKDLPLLINQWVNVVRWELRPRPFLRTTEFLWQEGHTAHETKEDADKMTLQMLEVYREFVEEYLAIPVIKGAKSESEKFAGAVYTTCIEAMMQDGKALQVGTSHMLGQNFAKPFKVKFLNQNGKEQYVWQTSWGVSTRIIGALIMTHSDDKGLVIPPRIAPIQVVIIPIWDKDTDYKLVKAEAEELANSLKEINISVHIDDRDDRPGPKYYEWERKGIPLRVEIGPRDLKNKSVVLVRRDDGSKTSVLEQDASTRIRKMLDDIHNSLFKRAREYRANNTQKIDNWDEFQKTFSKDNGFILSHWCGNADCEKQIQEITKATIRCIPLDQIGEKGHCIFCGKQSNKRVVFAKAY